MGRVADVSRASIRSKLRESATGVARCVDPFGRARVSPPPNTQTEATGRARKEAWCGVPPAEAGPKQDGEW